jgi:hypothetical protein
MEETTTMELLIAWEEMEAMAAQEAMTAGHTIWVAVVIKTITEEVVARTSSEAEGAIKVAAQEAFISKEALDKDRLMETMTLEEEEALAVLKEVTILPSRSKDQGFSIRASNSPSA